MAAWAVIGAGYGDEGKGRMVDALAYTAGPGTLVVRTNGGAQAGHSVQTPDGRRHVFHHIGSGALAGAATHLSRWFVHHPMLLGAEIEALARLGACTTISADPRGYVTTPWDMLVNQLVEKARGSGRHGSCGYGFGETVGRCEETGYGLALADLAAPDLSGRLRAIRDLWAPARLAALGVAALAEEDRVLLASDAVLERFLADCAAFLRYIQVAPDASIGRAASLIFEGAQGLMLDQHHADFPHVTRSSTGLTNMLKIAQEAGIETIDALYVTRCYLTRHGRGPMPNEGDIGPAFLISDPTNIPNDWQEHLRFGELDLDVLRGAIHHDLRAAQSASCRVTPHLGVTCLDQARGLIPYRIGGKRVLAAPADFLTVLASAVGVAAVTTAHGPTRKSVTFAPQSLPALAA